MPSTNSVRIKLACSSSACLSLAEKGAHVAAVGQASDVVVDRGGRAVELQDIAGRVLLQKLAAPYRDLANSQKRAVESPISAITRWA